MNWGRNESDSVAFVRVIVLFAAMFCGCGWLGVDAAVFGGAVWKVLAIVGAFVVFVLCLPD